MKKSEIKIGGHYLAKVNGKVVTVRVDAIRTGPRGISKNDYSSYDVTNLATGRKTTFRSAAKFRRPINPVEVERFGIAGALANELMIQRAEQERLEDEQRPDPTEPSTATATSTSPGCSGPLTPTFGGLSAKLQDALDRQRDDSDDSPHLIVEARAGTGKTFTLIVGVINMFREVEV
jgi:hypothetical protein